MPLIALCNGSSIDSIDLTDRGLAYGDGLFETLRLRQGRAPLLDWHWARLDTGCKRLAIEFPAQALRADLSLILARAATLEDAVVKIVLTRGAGGRGYSVSPGAEPTRLVMLFDWPERPSSWWQEGVKVWPCETRLGINPALAGIKHLNRLENVLARLEWSDSAVAEGLMRSTQGAYIEGTSSNLFLVQANCLVTPDLTESGVAGIIRALILDRWATEFPIPLRTGTIDEQMLASADEVFLTNSLIGAWPVIECGHRRWQPGPICRLVQQQVAKVYS